jgi:hypothetical protein
MDGWVRGLVGGGWNFVVLLVRKMDGREGEGD